MKASFFSARNCFLLAAALFSLQIIPRWWGDSIVMDEEWELTSAYYFWKAPVLSDEVEPSVFGALAAVPLLFMDLNRDPSVYPNYENRSFSFLYLKNQDRLASITLWGRAVSLVFGLLTGFLLYCLTRDALPAERIAAMVLWAFEPNLLAFTGTAKPDISAVFWFFLCLVFFSTLKNNKKNISFAWFGFLAGAAFLSRYNSTLIVPVILILGFFYGPVSWDSKSFKRIARKVTFVFLGFCAAVFLGYLPCALWDPAHSSPFHFFIRNLKVLASLHDSISHNDSFFAGRLWERGSCLYFPHQFFFKNTIPFLIFLILAIFLTGKRKMTVSLWVWVAPTAYLGLYWLLNPDMVVRHAMLAVPFLILLAAKAFQWLWKTCRAQPSPILRSLPILLLVWHPLSVLCNFPHHIAYANDFLTDRQKPDQLSKFNCSLDQDVKRLAETGRERGWKKVKLLSSGRTDPYFYGLDWEPWTLGDLSSPQPGTVYVVDPFILKQYKAYRALFLKADSWVSCLEPTGEVGGTFYYYEIPGEAPLDPTRKINSFPYYRLGIPPYRHWEKIPLQVN